MSSCRDRRRPGRASGRRRCAWCLALAVVLLLGTLGAAEDEPSAQLAAVRSRIAGLEQQLGELAAQEASARAEQEQLDAQLELAQARVEELELTLGATRDEIVAVRGEVDALAVEVEARHQVLARHLEMVALLGRPGPLQLLWDAARGGELEQAVATVAVLTSAQLKLIAEYDQVQTARAARLAELSRMMEQARGEAAQLVERRRELESTRARVEARLAVLAKEQRRTDTTLADLRQRAEALERLMEVIRSRQPFTAKDDIRRLRGALPWPVGAKVVQSFGRHYLPKYATYTVCNGLRLAVTPGAEVVALFPGQVAYASHFKGYGNMVVVDHGHQVYSLAAGLATIHVRVGQGVTMGKRLGLAGPAHEDGNLYLEIRVGEAPEDPRRWLQLEGAGGR